MSVVLLLLFVISLRKSVLIDTWSQKGYPVSYMTILFSILANHQVRHKATHKMVSLVIAHGHGFVWYVWEQERVQSHKIPSIRECVHKFARINRTNTFKWDIQSGYCSNKYLYNNTP